MTSELWGLVLVWTVGGQDLQTTGQDQDGLSLLDDRWVNGVHLGRIITETAEQVPRSSYCSDRTPEVRRENCRDER